MLFLIFSNLRSSFFIFDSVLLCKISKTLGYYLDIRIAFTVDNINLDVCHGGYILVLDERVTQVQRTRHAIDVAENQSV